MFSIETQLVRRQLFTDSRCRHRSKLKESHPESEGSIVAQLVNGIPKSHITTPSMGLMGRGVAQSQSPRGRGTRAQMVQIKQSMRSIHNHRIESMYVYNFEFDENISNIDLCLSLFIFKHFYHSFSLFLIISIHLPFFRKSVILSLSSIYI